MRVLLAILALTICAVAAAIKQDMIDIDVTTIKPSLQNVQKPPFNSGDDDDDDGSGNVQADDASGSGSGQPTSETPTTSKEIEARVVKTPKATPSLKTIKKTTEMPTKHSTEHVKYTEKKPTKKSTEKVVEVKRSTEPPSERVVTVGPTTEDDDMLGGGVSKDGDVAARKSEDGALEVLTKEVIAAVVVGGVCAIILIAFLVYRLRKRDEGSYILTDTGYKDTNKLRGDTGKEAFV